MSLWRWRKQKLDEFEIKTLYYFSKKNNIDTILSNGILPKNKVEEKNIPYESFADEGVQARRHSRPVYISGSGKDTYSVHDLVPVYLTPRTPTLFARREIQDDIFFCLIGSYILCGQEFAFTDGNAGSRSTQFYHSMNNLDQIPWDVVRASSWAEHTDGTRKRNAEFLIHPKIPVDRIWRIAVNNNALKEFLIEKVNTFGLDIKVTIDKYCFFDYSRRVNRDNTENNRKVDDEDDLPF
tara:strand:- start:4908 stop:5621 length:714 start_codon:yes stop_codon:yes gene_type:complete